MAKFLWLQQLITPITRYCHEPRLKMYMRKLIPILSKPKIYSIRNILTGSLQPYSGTIERLRPTKWAASALLARVSLYRQDYSKAALLANEVINNTSLYELESLNSVFLKNSRESIWLIAAC